ncbi:hypothetical protein N7465_000554 [Penicillium sp. CMV-2018d]|nr:hypothetical protein N7465_000554 [Penicillium sp. CMV-2018d]
MIETVLGFCHGLASGNCALSHDTVAHDVPFASGIGLNSEYYNIHVPKKWKIPFETNIET